MRRLAGFLARKGYSGPLSLQVVREVLAQTDDDAGGEADEDSAAAASLDQPVTWT
jgi:hypothetical protein